MQVNLPPDLETLVKKRLSSGVYRSVEDVFRRALEALDAEESWTDEERQALTAHIEEGSLQAERGDLIDGAQARREIQVMKDSWHQERISKPRRCKGFLTDRSCTEDICLPPECKPSCLSTGGCAGHRTFSLRICGTLFRARIYGGECTPLRPL